MPSVKVVELAGVMVDFGVHGSKEWIRENEDIGQRGSQLLRQQ
jgi:hypothetical protein